MKDFFEECLRNLEPMHGIRQYVYWQMEAGQDLAKAQAKVDLCVNAMISTCSQFPDIPEEKQKSFIKRMMREDQNYDSLNSRTVYKWLALYRQQTAPQSHISEEEWSHPPRSAETQKMIDEFIKNLSQSKEVKKMSYDEIRAEGQERMDPNLQGYQATRYQNGVTKADFKAKQKHIEYLGAKTKHESNPANYDENNKCIPFMSEEEFCKAQAS
jgi:hypothetical protein